MILADLFEANRHDADRVRHEQDGVGEKYRTETPCMKPHLEQNGSEKDGRYEARDDQWQKDQQLDSFFARKLDPSKRVCSWHGKGQRYDGRAWRQYIGIEHGRFKRRKLPQIRPARERHGWGQ